MKRLLLTLITLTLVGCGDDEPRPVPKPKKSSDTAPVGKKVLVGPNVWTEFLPGNKRRVLVSAEICLREGMLELILTRKGKKEHEAIFASEVDARKIHEALLLAGAKPGTPAKFSPKFVLPKGQRIGVSVRYVLGGTSHDVPVTEWVRSLKTKAEMEGHWVFAGSYLHKASDEPQAPLRYAANDGDVISVTNFDTAMLDVSFKSSKETAELGFEAWTARIPPKGTKVVLVLTPEGGK